MLSTALCPSSSCSQQHSGGFLPTPQLPQGQQPADIWPHLSPRAPSTGGGSPAVLRGGPAVATRGGHQPPRSCQPWLSSRTPAAHSSVGALFTLLISEGGVLIALNYCWKNWSGQQSIRLIYHPVPTRCEPAINCRHKIYY